MNVCGFVRIFLSFVRGCTCWYDVKYIIIKPYQKANSYVKCLTSTIMILVTLSHKNEFELRNTSKD